MANEPSTDFSPLLAQLPTEPYSIDPAGSGLWAGGRWIADVAGDLEIEWFSIAHMYARALNAEIARLRDECATLRRSAND